MGYRSDVMAVFYVKEAKHFPVLKLWLDENFPVKMFETSLRWFDRGMVVECSSVKWYDDYDDVKAFDAAVDKYLELVNNELGVDDDTPMFNYEFVRVGEDDEDIIRMYEGYDCECLLGVTREITCVV